MPVQRRDVAKSSSVRTVGYDEAARSLHVEWANGRVSVYSDVPPSLADDVSRSWSVGKALREQVIPHYEHRYLGDDE